jgi:hypothetical protein
MEKRTMTYLASKELMMSMESIEHARVEAEPVIGRQNAKTVALGELQLLLSRQQEALQARPYGYGHAWNVWALTVAIAQLQESKGTLRHGQDANG